MKRAAYLSLALSSILTPCVFASAEEILDENRSPSNLHHDEGYLLSTYRLNNKPMSVETEAKLIKEAIRLKSVRTAHKASVTPLHSASSTPVHTDEEPSSSSGGHVALGLAAPSAPAPVLIDLRPTCSPIQDQGNAGSCTAHSLEGALEQAMIRKTGKYVNFSRLASYYHARALMGKAEGNESEYLLEDSGATIGDAALSVLTGLVPESLWPYKDDGATFKKQPLPSCYAAGLKWLNTTGISFVKVDGTKDAILTQLNAGKPVMFGMTLQSSFMSSDVAKTGQVPMPKAGESAVGGHAMLIVGYSSTTQRFIVRNSWSTNWGDKGYCYIPEALITKPDVTYDLWRVSDVVNIQTVDAATQKSLERAQAQKAVFGTKKLPEPIAVLDEHIIEKAKVKKTKRPFALTLTRQLTKLNILPENA